MRNRHKRSRHDQAGAPPAPRTGMSRTPIHLRRSLALFVILLATMLLLWRLVLLKPMLALSRDIVEVSFSLLPSAGSAELITMDSNGDWIVRASLLFPAREATRQASMGEVGVRTSRKMLQCFSLCFPIFWALALAAWPGRRVWPVLGMGTLLLTITSQLSLVLFLAYWINNFYVVASTPWGTFWMKLAGNCTMDVIPYAAPLLLIIWLDRGLRSLVFGESKPQIPPGPGS
ncbi:membrane hypothetical protein [Candidatus Sulfopaludibacter sp. SbA4]|nr:membrane hypothetical protein [Candidatus Sulfopaludibacter sp. SbA4]